MLTGAIYCRVSTDGQRKEGMSLPAQLESARNLIKAQGGYVPEENVFLESYSGWDLKRPKLDKLRLLAKNQEIDFVILSKHDRLARDQFAYQMILKDFSDAWVRVFYSEEGSTGDDEIDDFIWSTIVNFAQWERGQIKKRTMLWKRQHAKSGRWPFGHVLYGFQKNPVTKMLELFPSEAEVFKRIVGWYLEEGLTICAIAKRLVDEWVLPPSMSEKDGPNQRANRKNLKNSSLYWGSTAVQRLLSKAPTYAGTYQAFQKKWKKSEGKAVFLWERAKEDWVEISIPAIITKQQAEAVVEKLESNRRFAKKRSVRSYMLQGKLRCTCQSDNPHFIGYYRIDKKLKNYRCNMHRPDKVSEERRCSNQISALKIEPVIIDTLRELLLDPEYLFELAIDRYLEGGEGDKKDTYSGLYAMILEIKDKRERAEDLFIDGSIKKDRLKEIIARLNEEEDRISKEMGKELEIIKSVALKEGAKRTWKEFLDEERELAERFFDEATYDDFKDLINIFVDRIVLTTEKKQKVVRMVFKLPVTPAFAGKYLEDEEITWTDEEGKDHIVSVIPNSPKFIPLDPTKAPLKYRTVEFIRNGGDEWDENQSDNPESPQRREEKRLISLLREKYHQICKLDHFCTRSPIFMGFYSVKKMMGSAHHARLLGECNSILIVQRVPGMAHKH